jgi:hypothetical protein
VSGMRNTAVRYTAYACLAVLGALVGVAGALVQDGWLPFGLLLALAGSGALFYGGALLTGTRVGAAVPVATWLFAVIVCTTSRPEGDFVFASGFAPYVYLLCGSMAGVMCATLHRLPGAGRAYDQPGA